MDTEPVYLRQNVCVKPLVAGWCATEQLIPPVQAALNFKNVYLELLSSYLAAPEHHWQAARTPALLGGPWVDVEPARAPRVREFLSWTERTLAEPLALADDVLALDRLLREEAKGGSLARLYPRVPGRLRGYVELGYDAAHQPSMRLIESLLYRSRYQVRSLQSLALVPLSGDSRAPQFTTPLLDDDPAVRLRRPFADEAFDELFTMKTRPRPFGAIRERLGVGEADAAAFRRLFTTKPPGPPRNDDLPGLRVRYFGHACVLFETKDVSVLLDPVVSYAYAGGPSRFTHRELPERIDVVAVTHFHKDHLNLETLLQLRCRVGTLVIPKNGGGAVQDPSFRLAVQHLGFRHVVELERLEALPVPGGEVTALPFLGEHADLDIQSKAAFLVRLGGTATLCAADSSNLEPALYAHLNEVIGDIDILFLGMECVGAPLSTTYGGILLRRLPRSYDQERRTTGSDYTAALGIIEVLRPKRVYIYAMGLEPWLGHLLPMDPDRDRLGVVESDRLIAECCRRGIAASRPYCADEILLPPSPGAP
jgi:L-ascorbate metabolism protein UlaG (beta-lactamase superfamily)